jgi:hypothetical protein
LMISVPLMPAAPVTRIIHLLLPWCSVGPLRTMTLCSARRTGNDAPTQKDSRLREFFPGHLTCVSILPDSPPETLCRRAALLSRMNGLPPDAPGGNCGRDWHPAGVNPNRGALPNEPP